jgi:hypothetical protein
MRVLLSIVAVWALLVPSLCLAGAFGHPCDDCGDGLTCGHEEECAEDPCSEAMVRPVAAKVAPDLGSCPAGPALQALMRAPSAPTAPANLHPPNALLPLPESDLPLRN